MVNYRVDDLHALVKVLREEGCNVLEKIDESEYGKFAWVIDPEGNKVEALGNRPTANDRDRRPRREPASSFRSVLTPRPGTARIARMRRPPR